MMDRVIIYYGCMDPETFNYNDLDYDNFPDALTGVRSRY